MFLVFVSVICRIGHISMLLKFHQHQRSELQWQLDLRGPRDVSTQLNLHDFGLIGLDVSSNDLGDAGIDSLLKTLGTDKCLEAIDLRDTGFTGHGLRNLVSLLEKNDSLTWIRFLHKPSLHFAFSRQNDPFWAQRQIRSAKRNSLIAQNPNNPMILLIPTIYLIVDDKKLFLPCISLDRANRTKESKHVKYDKSRELAAYFKPRYRDHCEMPSQVEDIPARLQHILHTLPISNNTMVDDLTEDDKMRADAVVGLDRAHLAEFISHPEGELSKSDSDKKSSRFKKKKKKKKHKRGGNSDLSSSGIGDSSMDESRSGRKSGDLNNSSILTNLSQDEINTSINQLASRSPPPLHI